MAPLSARPGTLGSCSCATSLAAAAGGARGLLGLALLVAVGVSVVGGPRLVRAAVAQVRHRAAVARGVTAAPSVSLRRELAWLVTPLGLVLAVFWLDLMAAGLFGLFMPLFWALEGDARIAYQWVVIEDFADAVFAMPVGGLMLWLGLKIAAPLANVEAWRTRRLLAPGLGDRVEWLTRTRAAALDASALELRRIERDLHDGAQARLVALAHGPRHGRGHARPDPEGAQGAGAEARTRRPSAAIVRAARPGPRHPSRRCSADRGLGGAVARWRCAAPVPIDVARRPARPAPARSSGGLLHRRRGADQRGQAQRRHRGIGAHRHERRTGCVHRASATTACGGADPARGSGLRGLERRARRRSTARSTCRARSAGRP